MAFDVSDALWDKFLRIWPIERLRAMRLADYTTAGSKDCFIHWIEVQLDCYGSIWGGSAFKFGIYSRSTPGSEESDRSRMYNSRYGWYRKFGDTQEDAFTAVRSAVVAIAQAAHEGRFEEIDDSPLGEAYRWKLAFLYQSRSAPTIVGIYSRALLLSALGLPEAQKSPAQSALYRAIAAQRGDSESILELSKRMLAKAASSKPYEVILTDGAIRNGYLNIKFAMAPFPSAMCGGKTDANLGEQAHFRTDTGLEFASDLRSSSETNGRLRHRLGGYFSSIQAKEGDRLYISPEEKGGYLISRNANSTLATHRAPTNSAIQAPGSENSIMAKPPLNQILYGPPGTGKTYHAITKALEILDPRAVERHATTPGGRAALKRRFDELEAAGLVRFVTFHQSFSYEDFVEGLRATTDESTGALRYEVADGVFKLLCDAARVTVTHRAEAPLDITGRQIWKMSLGNNSDSYIFDECIEKGIALLGYGAGVDFAGCTTREEIHRRLVKAGEKIQQNDYAVTAVHTFVTQVKVGDVLVVTDGLTKFRAIGEVTSEYRWLPRDDEEPYMQCRSVRWIRVYKPSLAFDQLMSNQFSQMTIYRLRDGSIDFSKLEQLLKQDESEAGEPTPRVLIIDEINRGNVSRILGELITPIEPSKRAGAKEALKVVLPYSKEPFSVPLNLYLIGTMNTADRSLTGLDIALRRRFEFVEMPSRPDLLGPAVIEGVHIQTMLTVMNQRIEVLLDRDHHIGHAYFMPLLSEGTLSNLAAIFRSQVLPLLQEYFFEDWERIRWVLNDQNKAEGHRFVVSPANDGAQLFGGTTDVPVQTSLWALDSHALDRRESYLGIIGV